MRKRTKVLVKLWFNRFLIVGLLALIVWANVICLRNNDFSNYEKAVDYGRISDDEDLIRPIVTAVFYEGKTARKGHISSYFNHSDNFKKKNVKIVIVPRKVTSYSLSVIEKLYEEIRKYNKIERIALVYSEDSDVDLQEKMLKRIMRVEDVSQIAVTENNLDKEEKLEPFFNRKGNLVIFLADLDKGLNEKDSDFLTGEAVYFAQKYFYQMNVFDIIDTQMARAQDKGYDSLYPATGLKDEPLLVKQKHNLERYKKHYWHALSGYFEINLFQILSGNQEIMPPRVEENYRLYDRGRLVLKAYDENYLEIFEQAELEENEGISVLIIKAARALVTAGKAKDTKYCKIYLLTEMERINKLSDTMLMSYLDVDDGVYATYKGKEALLVADDRPDNPEDLASAVRQKAGIATDVLEEDIDFYRFKTVEMQYGD